MVGKIFYVTGDVVNPKVEGNKIVCHICNDIGVWNSKFARIISNKWRQPEIAYRNMKKRSLGHTDFIRVAMDTMVANIIGLHNIVLDEDGNPPIRYDAIRIGLTSVNIMAHETGSTIHIPRIGFGITSEQWDEMEIILKKVVSVDIYVYNNLVDSN